MKNKNHNNFIILLSVFAVSMVLFVTLFNFSNTQSLKSEAGKTYCEGNIDCPKGTACTNGLCLIVKTTITQTPMAYVDITTLVEKPKPIPAIYVSPTPTPTIGVLEMMSNNINGSIGELFNMIIRFFGALVGKAQTMFE